MTSLILWLVLVNDIEMDEWVWMLWLATAKSIQGGWPG
jgi:hypothetical protein